MLGRKTGTPGRDGTASVAVPSRPDVLNRHKHVSFAGFNFNFKATHIESQPCPRPIPQPHAAHRQTRRRRVVVRRPITCTFKRDGASSQVPFAPPSTPQLHTNDSNRRRLKRLVVRGVPYLNQCLRFSQLRKSCFLSPGYTPRRRVKRLFASSSPSRPPNVHA